MTTYGGAPFFTQLEYFMNELYVKNKWENLSELNRYSITLISEFLGIKTEFVNSKDYELSGDRVQRLLNLVKNLGGTEYLSGPSAKDYLRNFEHLFGESGIKLTYKAYPEYPEYRQLNSPFEQFVSIFDMIANLEQNSIKKFIWDLDSGR
jgi:hypothetical protein